MAREEHTADGFPDKSEFIPPAKIRKKPDCDRKTLIPDPCDLRVDRRKKTEENNDCNTEPVVQVCPEDIGKFRIPELPTIPTVFTPKRFEPLIVPRLPDPPPPDSFCNDPITEDCPSDGWLDADWVEQNINTNVTIERDEFGGVKNIQELNIDPAILPDDPKIFIPVDPERKEFGGSVTIDECSFVAATKEEANKKAKIFAIESLNCEFCSPEVKVDCEDLQSLALPIGGIGYTIDNTELVIQGDGVGAQLSPQIDEQGTIIGVNIDEPGEGYSTISISVEGDGEGAVVGRVLLDNEDGCGGAILEVEMGQTLPDPNYDPEIDPPIKSKTTVCVPACTFSSTLSQEDADEQARTAALAALDCYYQSKELNKPCTPPTIPKNGYDLPLGAFTTRIDRGTQLSVDTQAQEIIDALECIEIPCPDGFPGAVVDIDIIDPNDKCNNNSGGNPSTFGATFDEANCMYKLDGTLVLPEIPCPCGFTTTSSVSQGAGGDQCDAPEWNATAVYTYDCGYADWLRTKRYYRGNFVKYKGDVYVALKEVRYQEPNDPNSDWDYVSQCLPDPYKVTYKYKLYQNTRWSRGDVPGESGSTWRYLGRCGTPPPDEEEEEEEEECNASIDLGVIVSGGGADFDFDLETCTFDFNLELPSVQLTCESIDFSVSGGEFTANVNSADTFGASVVTSGNTCVTGDGCGLELELPDIALEINVPCPEGFSATSDLSVVGGSVSGGAGLDITSSDCESNISMNIDGCNIDLSGEICIPDINIDLNIPCPDGINASSSFTVTGLGSANVSGALEASFENCEISLDGDLVIEVPNIPCPDGITTSSTFTVTGTNSATVSGSGLSTSFEDCELRIEGDIDIDVPEIPCPEGMSAASGVELLVTGGGASGGGSITAEVVDCEIILDGILEIDVPELPEIPCPQGIIMNSSITISGENAAANTTGNIEIIQNNCVINLVGDIVVDVPEVECADGINVSGSPSLTVTGAANGGGNLTFTMDGCNLQCGGEFNIDVPEVEVPCPNGFSSSGSISCTVTSDSNASEPSVNNDVGLNVDGCNLTLDGSIDITIPKVDVPCPDGITTCASTYTDEYGTWYTSNGEAATTSAGIEIITGTGYDGDGSSNVELSVDNCSICLSGSIQLPNVELPNIPNIACANGITASGDAEITVSGNSGATSNGSISLSGEGCNITLNGSIEIDIPEVNIPNIACANGITACASTYTDEYGTWYTANGEAAPAGAGSGIEIITGAGYEGNASSNIELSVEDCSVCLSGSIQLPNVDIPNIPNIACANGITASGDATVTVTGNSGATSNGSISLSGEGCNITLDGSIDIEIPEVNVPCSEGFTTTGGATVTASGIANGGGTISASLNDCELELTGDIDIYVPDGGGGACANGITASGSAGLTVSGSATGGGNITLAVSNNCEVQLSGDLEIDVPEPNVNISCSDIDGALCDGDYSTITLSVCDPSGSTSSVTVLTLS